MLWIVLALILLGIIAGVVWARKAKVPTVRRPRGKRRPLRPRAYGFFIEFRLHGYAKEYAKNVILDIAKKFRVKGVTKTRAVPHITLYGPSTTDDIRKVVSEVIAVGQKHTLVPFKIRGFDYFEKPSRVIYLDITPSAVLEQLRWELCESLRRISNSQPSDMAPRFKFHSTIAFKDIDRKFDRIWAYIKAREEPNINQYLLRITIMGRHRRILCEYDLVRKRLLNRRQALSRTEWNKTINKLGELLGLPREGRR